MTDFKKLRDQFNNQKLPPAQLIITREHLEHALNEAGGFVGMSEKEVAEGAQLLCEHEDELWYQLAKDIK